MFEKLVALDIWLMRHVFGGLPGETMSSAAWNAHITGRFFGFTHHIIDLIFRWWERDHCRQDWEWRQEIYKETP